MDVAGIVMRTFPDVPAPAESIARHLEDDKGKQRAVRHHFASWFMMPGGQLQALQTILGHASLTMTLR